MGFNLAYKGLNTKNLEDFGATKFNEIFSGRQTRFRNKLVPETSENLHILTWLFSRENFVEKIVMFKKNEDL
jgi:hypothetical protein